MPTTRSIKGGSAPTARPAFWALLLLAMSPFMAPLSAGANSISGSMWNDLNRNGLQDEGEPALTNLGCALVNSASGITAVTTNDAAGQYVFTNVTNGCYRVLFEEPPAFKFTIPDAGPDDVDSDVLAGSNHTPLTCITNSDLTHVDAGYYMRVPGLALTVLAGPAPAGTTLYVTGGTFVAYRYVVANVGETFLLPLYIYDDVLDLIWQAESSCDVFLSPGDAWVYTTTVQVANSSTNRIEAAGAPVDFHCSSIPGIDITFQEREAVVVVVPDGDTDGDGLTDLQEYQIETDPNDPSSYLPRVHAWPIEPDTMTLLVDPSSTARLYELFSTTNLLNAPQVWTPFGAAVTGTGAALSFLVTNDAPERTYRAGARAP